MTRRASSRKHRRAQLQRSRSRTEHTYTRRHFVAAKWRNHAYFKPKMGQGAGRNMKTLIQRARELAHAIVQPEPVTQAGHRALAKELALAAALPEAAFMFAHDYAQDTKKQGSLFSFGAGVY